MYIRRAQTRGTVTGEHYFTYRLVRTERIAGKVKQLTLLNLGRHFTVDQALWPTMCARLEELIQGQASLMEMELPMAVASEAQRIAAQCLTRMAQRPAQSGSDPSAAAREPDVQAVDGQIAWR